MQLVDQESPYAKSLIEAVLDPLVTISLGGKITGMNQAAINITGIKREVLLGTDFINYFTEPKKARKAFKDVFTKGSVANTPLTLKHITGKLTTILFSGSILKIIRS